MANQLIENDPQLPRGLVKEAQMELAQIFWPNGITEVSSIEFLLL